MSWGAIAGAAISIGGSMIMGKKGEKQADAQMAQQQWMNEQQIALGKDQLQFARDQYNDHKAKFDPLFDDIRGMMDDTEPDYGAIAGDVYSAFDSAQGMEERNMRRYGIKPTDGAARQSQREYGIKRGAAHVGARSAARQGAKDKRYGRYADLYNAGMGIASNNAAMVSNSMVGLGNMYGQQAMQAGRNAGYYNDMAAQNAAGWGQMVGGVDWGGIFNGVKGWFNKPNSSGGGGYTGRGGGI